MKKSQTQTNWIEDLIIFFSPHKPWLLLHAMWQSGAKFCPRPSSRFNVFLYIPPRYIPFGPGPCIFKSHQPQRIGRTSPSALAAPGPTHWPHQPLLRGLCQDGNKPRSLYEDKWLHTRPHSRHHREQRTETLVHKTRLRHLFHQEVVLSPIY